MPVDTPGVVLWDIDHTLLTAPGLGGDIYARIFPKVTGVAFDRLATVDGRTELAIIADTLTAHGLTPTNELIARVAKALAEGYAAAADELRARGSVLPGAREALIRFQRAGLRQSVLTGNTRAVARIKLTAVELESYLDLDIGAYGDDHAERAELVAVACQRAGQRGGEPVASQQVLLIGDTPADVEAAMQTGVRIVAVASGKFSVADLRAAGADHVIESLIELTERHLGVW